VIVALKSFGFSQREAEDALKAVGDQTLNTSVKVKMALKYLGK
jgi:Holliday junction resolvasome RuvABC DNA-binding subunit